MQGMQLGSFGSGQYVSGGETPQHAKQRIVKTDGSTVKVSPAHLIRLCTWLHCASRLYCSAFAR